MFDTIGIEHKETPVRWITPKQGLLAIFGDHSPVKPDGGFSESSELVHRRQRTYANLSGLAHYPRTFASIPGDPSVADLGEDSAVALVFGEAQRRGLFLTDEGQLDEVVRQLDTVAKEGNVSWTLGVLFADRCEEPLPEPGSTGRLHPTEMFCDDAS